jgi:hypothetical protein
MLFVKMSGGSSRLRGRSRYQGGDSFDKREVQDIIDLKTDYSDQKSWQDCISRIAIAQYTIGVKPAMSCVESTVSDIESRRGGYIYCSPSQLEEALRRMRKFYLSM